MLHDLPAIAAATLLFASLALFPGYLLAHLLNLWEFRTRPLSFQVSVSIPLSLSVGPIVTFLAWKIAWLIYLFATMASIVILLRNRPALTKTLRAAILIALGWAFFAALWLMDWQLPGRLYFPTYALDYSTRAAMVHSLAAFGLPAQTPFFNPGHPVQLHYHFLWLLQCALVHSVAPNFITARYALSAGSIWCGLGLISVAVLAMRILMQLRGWIVAGLLTVTGLDIVPAFCLLAANRLHLVHTLPPSAEWWNEQVDGFVYTVLWEPHYICALIGCLTGFLISWQTRRPVLLCVAALCYASAVGSGSFVALVFAAFLACWTLLNLRSSLPMVITGLLTILFSLPYLATLKAPFENAGGPALLQFTIRPFSPFPLPALSNLLLLPVNYFLELGFFAACVFIGYRRKLDLEERTLLLMAFVSVVICTFVKSGATPNNDLGWRGFLVAQFALLILSAAYLERQPTIPRFLKLLLFLGLAGTVYDLTLTRFFPILSDANLVPKLKWLAIDQKLGQRTLANRDAYQYLHQHSSQTAILGQNPDVDSVDIFYGLYADRPIIAGDRTCTIGFGGTVAECAPINALLSGVFSGHTTFKTACDAFPAALYTVKDTDPVWRLPDTWVLTTPPVFANQFVRIFSCNRSN